MGEFISGMLESNDEGATYEGVVYDRFLTLRHVDGAVLMLFDMGEPIATGLPTGETYEMIVAIAIPGNLRYSAPPLAASDHGDQQGIVVEPHWSAPKDCCDRSRPELFSHEWVLLATPLGHALIDPGEIDATVGVGSVLSWQNPRLDLYAVVSPVDAPRGAVGA